MLDKQTAGSTTLRSGRDVNFVAKWELLRKIIDSKNCHPDKGSALNAICAREPGVIPMNFLLFLVVA
jgi:hypothetical protein